MEKNRGVFQLPDGHWGYRFVLTIDGKEVNRRRTRDETGKPFKTQKQALKARQQAIIQAHKEADNRYVKLQRRTVGDVWKEYCEHGRTGKAYGTVRKQDALWNVHLRKEFARRYVDEITVAEINDYLADLYYCQGYAFGYVESFIKMFYLIFGQAYSRGYLDVEAYNKRCTNKDTRIRMPKRKIDDDDDVVVFSKDELHALDQYFKGTTLETAYMVGRYCGVRINEAFGIKWSDVDLQRKTIRIERQMQYQEGVIRLVPVKTRNGRRTIYMSDALCEYLEKLHERLLEAEVDLAEMREQQQMMIQDTDGEYISSLELINTLPNGKMRTINSMKRHTREIRDKLGITFRFHFLRHTYGTRMAELGMPPHLLCSQMGHASSKVTEKYYLGKSKTGIDLILDKVNQI